MKNKSQEAKYLYARLEDKTDSNVLDVSIGSPMKPVFTVTIEVKRYQRCIRDVSWFRLYAR